MTLATTGNGLLFALGLRHHDACRSYIQFASNAAADGGGYDVLYMRGE